jgi:hypothetical protein
MTSLKAERLREVLSYDPATGIFTRLVNTGNVHEGDPAGCINKSLGYAMITIDYKRYYAHRLAWLYMTGEWPAAQIDHINMDRADNRWDNLRLATKSQNMSNRGAQSNNTSGIKGVDWDRARIKWRAQICASGRRVCLGRFDTREEAQAAYVIAVEKYHGGFARIT